MIGRLFQGLVGLALLMMPALTEPAMADTGSENKTVGNVDIYMGLLPAEMIRGHPAGHPESSMHGGRPTASGQYHVVIALFNTKGYTRIENAEVTARVGEIGLAPEEKQLEPMKIAGTVTYGNYFRMAGHGPFRISLTIHIPGEPQAISAEFEHRHQ